MTASPSIDPEVFPHEQLAQASPDLMRHLLQTFINTLLSNQADAERGWLDVLSNNAGISATGASTTTAATPITA